MTIGIPRALLWHKYGTLWEAFFQGLGVGYVLSPETDKAIFNDGLRAAMDESCLPAKVFLGHVASLIGRCDFILVPRVETLNKADSACVKFFALRDVVWNVFAPRLKAAGTEILDYNVNVAEGLTEEKAFIRMGKELGAGRRAARAAYGAARAAQNLADQKRAENALNKLAAGYPKILVAGHAYNVYDPYIGAPAVRYLEKLGATPILANEFDAGLCAAASPAVSKPLYWAYNKELAGAVSLYHGGADGLVFLTAFPCGPDSLVVENLMRKFPGVPKLHLVLDELQNEAGLRTRLESFVDIIVNEIIDLSPNSRVG